MSKFPYEDIINLPYRKSKTRQAMSMHDRAAQFSPFAAVVGHDAAVEEAARHTDIKLELDDYEKEFINNKLQYICEHLKEEPHVSITYFKPDEKKEGGSYETITGTVRRIHQMKRVIQLTDETDISIDDITEIEIN